MYIMVEVNPCSCNCSATYCTDKVTMENINSCVCLGIAHAIKMNQTLRITWLQ